MSANREERFNQFLKLNNIKFENGVYKASENDNIDGEFSSLKLTNRASVSSECSAKRTIDFETEQPYVQYTDSLRYKVFPKYEIEDQFYCEERGNLLQCYKQFTFIWSCNKLVVLKDGKDWKTIETYVYRETIDWNEMYDSDVDDSDWDEALDMRVAPRREDPSEGETPVESIVQFVPHTVHQIKISKFKGKDVLCVVVNSKLVVYDLTNFTEESPKLEVILVMNTEMTFGGCAVDTYGDYIVYAGLDDRIIVTYVKDLKYPYCYEHYQSSRKPKITDVKITYATDEEVWITTTTGNTLHTYIFDNIAAEDQVEETPEYQISPYLKFDKHIIYSLKNHTLKLREIQNEVTDLTRSGLTLNTINLQYFKKVQSLEHLGSLPIDIDSIQNSGKTLEIPDDPFSSELNHASKYQTVRTLTSAAQASKSKFEGITSTTDKISQIKQHYLSNSDLKYPKDLDSELLILTTKNNIGLFTLDSLLCLAETSTVFPDLQNRMQRVNTLSMVRLIPELSALVLLSPAGMVSVFRLVEYRGLYSLRQEFIYPLDKEVWSQNTTELIGIDVKRATDELDDEIVYWIYIMDINSGIVKLELSLNEDEFLDTEFI